MKKNCFLLVYIVSQVLASQSFDFETPLAAYTEEHGFSGNILIQQDSSLVFFKSYGHANKEFQVPNDRLTKFRIASVTKLFTSVLIYQLVDQKRLDLNGLIGTYLPEYKGEAKNAVTIYQLLTATSGIADFEINGDEVYEKRLNTDVILDQYCSGKLQSSPGTKFIYNNADFVILGKILEKIYQKPYNDILKKNILNPLDMGNTGVFDYGVVTNLAQCYWYNEETKKTERDIPYFVENYGASGAMYSTVDDLLAFSNALHQGKLISKEALEKLLTPLHDVENSDNYASGLWVYEYNISENEKHKAASRQGNIWGAEAMVLKIFNNNTSVIILSNNIGDSGMWDLVWKIKRTIYNK